MNYLRWRNGRETPYGCVLSTMTGLSALSPLWQGEAVAQKFPTDVEFLMSPDFPDDTVLTDNLHNNFHLIIGSEKLVKYLKQLPAADLEYLKVAIRDHKRKIAGYYFVINPVGALDCLDREASGAVLAPGTDAIIDVDEVIVKHEMLDGSRILVRIADFPEGILVRADVAAELGERGFTGIYFEELGASGA